jgi:hypothetical protein
MTFEFAGEHFKISDSDRRRAVRDTQSEAVRCAAVSVAIFDAAALLARGPDLQTLAWLKVFGLFIDNSVEP